MTLPEWVAPDPPDDTRAGPPPAEPRPADRLAAKPVLDWTDDDWAQWIESAEPVRLPPPAEGEEPTGHPPAAEPPVATVAEAEAPAETVEEVPEAAGPVTEGVEEAPGPGLDVAPDPADAAGSMAPPAPTGEDATEDDGADQDWGRVADHPWWSSAPAPDENAAAVLAPAPDEEATPALAQSPAPTLVDDSPAAGALQPVARPSGPSRTKAKAKPEPRPAPASRAKPRPAPRRPEREHRLRSALGLLGMAVMTGMILAALITVAVVSVSLVVQRALGD